MVATPILLLVKDSGVWNVTIMIYVRNVKDPRFTNTQWSEWSVTKQDNKPKKF